MGPGPTGRELRRFDHPSGVNACAYSPDGSRLLSASNDGKLREWDLARPEPQPEPQCFDGHSGGVTACAYSPDGSRVLSGSNDSTLREWDRATRRELQRFEGHSGGVTACAYSPDGSHILSASDDSTVKIWSRREGRCLETLFGAAPFRCAVATRKHLVAGDALGNLWLLDCEWF